MNAIGPTTSEEIRSQSQAGRMNEQTDKKKNYMTYDYRMGKRKKKMHMNNYLMQKFLALLKQEIIASTEK